MQSPVELYTAITEDGSLSLISGEYLQLYHNRSGAFTEALIDYSNVTQTALTARFGGLPERINILDCCFGLGYNSLVIAQELPRTSSLNVTAIELDPTVLTFVPQVLNQSWFAPLRKNGFNDEIRNKFARFGRIDVNDTGGAPMHFDLIESDLRDFWKGQKKAFADEKDKLHAILHDPFSPKKMPELWTYDLFEKYRDALVDGGIVITYSSAPVVRAAFLDLGFHVYKTPVLGGKWGGTLAVLGDYLQMSAGCDAFNGLITPLGPIEWVRLVRSSRVPFRDPDLSSSREEILENRLLEQERFRG